MDDRLDRLEAKVEALTSSLATVERRLADLERETFGIFRPRRASEGAGEEAEAASPDFLGQTALVGRTVMALGGAFLLRAVTESGALPQAGGVALGLAYALVWLIAADRASARRRATSAAFHGTTATIIAFPLIWEAASRFDVLSPVSAAVVWGVTAALLVGVSYRRRLRTLAWISTAAAVATAWALMIGVKVLAPFVLGSILLAAAVSWWAPKRSWLALPWVPDLAADLAVLLLAGKVVMARGETPPGAVVLIQLALFLLFSGMVSARSLRTDWKLRAGKLVQVIAVVAVGYGGAMWVAAPGSATARALGLVSLFLSAAAFTAALVLVADRARRRPAFLYHAAIGFPLLLGGTHLLLPEPLRTLAWAALVVVAAWLAHRNRSVTLSLESAVLALVAAFGSGLLTQAAAAFTFPATRPWPAFPTAGLALLAAIAIACCLPVTSDSPGWGRLVALPKALHLLILTIGAGAAVLAVAAPAIAGQPGDPGTDPVLLAALRTALLSIWAVALAWLGRREHLREARLWVYPLLLATGMKLLVEDFRLGRAQELFVALALYGAALIVAPRLSRRTRPPSEHPAGNPP